MVFINEVFLVCVSFVITMITKIAFVQIIFDNEDQVRPIQHTFKERGQRSVKVREDKDKYGSSSQDSASESEEQIDYEETEAQCIVKCHDVAVVCREDGFSYYLVKLSKHPFTTTESVKDDYGHYIPANINVIEGNYF